MQQEEADIVSDGSSPMGSEESQRVTHLMYQEETDTVLAGPSPTVGSEESQRGIRKRQKLCRSVRYQ